MSNIIKNYGSYSPLRLLIPIYKITLNERVNNLKVGKIKNLLL